MRRHEGRRQQTGSGRYRTKYLPEGGSYGTIPSLIVNEQKNSGKASGDKALPRLLLCRDMCYISSRLQSK
jgi:hypothetical protein